MNRKFLALAGMVALTVPLMCVNPAWSASANQAQEAQLRAQQEAMTRMAHAQQEQEAKNAQASQFRAQQAEAAKARENAARAMQAEQQRAQEQAMKAQQQEQFRAQQEAARAQQAARENAVRAQEEAARVQQQQAARMAAAEGARQQKFAQEQALQNQRVNAEKAAAVQQEGRAAAMQQAERNQAVQQAERNQAVQQAERNQAVQQAERNQVVQQAERNQVVQQAERNQAVQQAERNQAIQQAERGHLQQQQMELQAHQAQANFQNRSFKGPSIPLNQAMAMPTFASTITAAENEHAQQVLANYNAHLIGAQNAPSQWDAIRQANLNNYMNNYGYNWQNQNHVINPQSTYVSSVPEYEYPNWWHQQPGWMFSNGFTFGNGINSGLDWLRWGWHPYYGAPPDGFVCAANYVPTPWIYFPDSGLWRQPGVMGWAPGGPPFGYNGPISVEVLEPRHIRTRDFFGHDSERITNVPYLYNAFFVPEMDRWGYTNHRGRFIWLNFGENSPTSVGYDD